jgi:uncharacterized membrane protein
VPWPGVKWVTVLMLLGPTAFLAVRSPLTLLCAPTLLWRFASGNSHYWGVAYHYSAVLMPIVFGGFVHALNRVRMRRPVRRGLLAGSAAVTLALIPFFPLRELAMPSEWTTSPHVRAANAILSQIPDGATVAASNRLAAQLVHRMTVTLVCSPQTNPGPAWVVVDSTDSRAVAPCSSDAAEAALAGYEAQGYQLMDSQDGVTLLRR